MWNDPNYERREYDPMGAYGQSKTANNLFALEVDQRGQDNGIRGFSLHPGSIVTNLARYASAEDLKQTGVVDENGDPIINPAKNMKTPEQGAATSVWCATSPQLDGLGGVYCENCDIASLVPELNDPQAAAQRDEEMRQFGSKPLGVMPYSVDPESATRLWELSTQLTVTGQNVHP